MNSTNTHLLIVHPTEGKDGKRWIFTGTHHICDSCGNTDVVPVLCSGHVKEQSSIKYACMNHLNVIACKKQVCNQCNKRALIKDRPSICQDCMKTLLNNFSDMVDVCKFPDVPRDECACKYCKMC